LCCYYCFFNSCRLRVEEADHGLTEDLFGGGSNSNSKDSAAAAAAPAAGLDGIPLKTLQDHVKLALELGQKLSSSSKSPSIVALFKELLTLVEGKLSLEETNEVRLYSLTLPTLLLYHSNRFVGSNFMSGGSSSVQ
jgi:Translation initiation factor eIF3 subunit